MSERSDAPPSASLTNADYWWYRARSELLRVVFQPCLSPGRLLDVGSADGPSVTWMHEHVDRTPMDIHPEGIPPGGVCGSVTALPFADASFRAVSAFDVIEHVEDDGGAVQEIMRVIEPGGTLLASVPAYMWAWTPFDVDAGHHRRYTRRQFVRLLTSQGLIVQRSTYAFTATFPLFALDRLAARLGLREPEAPGDSSLPTVVERVLLWLASLDGWLLRRMDLPYGSSIFVVATKPVAPHPRG